MYNSNNNRNDLQGMYLFLLQFILRTFNDTRREKLFYSIQYKNGCLASSDPFHMFTQSVLHIPSSHIKQYRCLVKVIHQVVTKTKSLLILATCTAKFDVVFVLTLENVSS